MEVIMSIQRSLKKGFTLIELMVVIVIIGILAAVAIPKLFRMSAKAKAQEVGPAAGTWVKMQLAYNMETGEWGDAAKISYILPGDASGVTSNFTYTVPTGSATSASWKAVSAFAADVCDKASEWSAELGKYGTVSEMKILNQGSKGDLAGCVSLTPNYYSIGCTNDSANKGKAPACVSGGAGGGGTGGGGAGGGN
jgi:prepilin-type N-terminal cleavage/methylation domain-containing protein